MKVIVVVIALTALMASPLFAQSQSTKGSTYPGADLEQKKQLRVGYQGVDGAPRKSSQPTSNPAPMKQGLCGTASSFCSDYYGGNGG